MTKKNYLVIMADEHFRIESEKLRNLLDEDIKNRHPEACTYFITADTFITILKREGYRLLNVTSCLEDGSPYASCVHYYHFLLNDDKTSSSND